MIPGTSRSAATIVGAMILGSNRTAAAEFSFFLAIPTLLVAGGYSFLKLVSAGIAFGPSIIALLATGSAVSFLVAYMASQGRI
jgi:undecaprenyl-diphosphatase